MLRYDVLENEQLLTAQNKAFDILYVYCQAQKWIFMEFIKLAGTSIYIFSTHTVFSAGTQ